MDYYQLINIQNINNINSTLQLIKLNDLTLGCSSKNSQQYSLKDCIAIYILLQPITDPSHILVIINTHLYWHPNVDNIRLRRQIL